MSIFSQFFFLTLKTNINQIGQIWKKSKWRKRNMGAGAGVEQSYLTSCANNNRLFLGFVLFMKAINSYAWNTVEKKMNLDMN